jgi:hypothetical protein
MAVSKTSVSVIIKKQTDAATFLSNIWSDEHGLQSNLSIVAILFKILEIKCLSVEF